MVSKRVTVTDPESAPEGLQGTRKRKLKKGLHPPAVVPTLEKCASRTTGNALSFLSPSTFSPSDHGERAIPRRDREVDFSVYYLPLWGPSRAEPAACNLNAVNQTAFHLNAVNGAPA